MTDPLPRTRRSLHGVAELILAGASYRAAGRIRLTVVPGGFTTVPMPGSPRTLRVEGTELVVEPASGATLRVPLQGTFLELANTAGVLCEAPQGVYSDGSGVQPGDAVELDPDAVRRLTDAFTAGDAALRGFSSAHGGEDPPSPVLWPEHFDVAIGLDEVNYGVSPGDGAISEPYAYVGPWSPREGAFWNVAFGAARTVDELGGDPSALRAFFEDGRDAAAR